MTEVGSTVDIVMEVKIIGRVLIREVPPWVFFHPYHDEEYSHFPVISMLCCDTNALLVCPLTLHLCPEMCVQQDTVTSSSTHDYRKNNNDNTTTTHVVTTQQHML